MRFISTTWPVKNHQSVAMAEDISLEDLFTDTEYVEQRVIVGKSPEIAITLKALNTASTDFDRTGQVLWPGARLLAEYLHSLPPNFFLDRSACEIGSGTGLVGLLCGQFCDTILTDHSSLVLDLLRDNTALNPTRHSVRCKIMDWERAEDVEYICTSSPQGKGFNLVLGADICYGLKALPYIFKAFAALMRPGPESIGLLGYVSRATAIDRGLQEFSAKTSLRLSQITESKDVGGGLQGCVFQIVWP